MEPSAKVTLPEGEPRQPESGQVEERESRPSNSVGQRLVAFAVERCASEVGKPAPDVLTWKSSAAWEASRLDG